MAQKKMTARQRQERAAKQQKTEIIVICCVAAALILGIILLVLLGGTATSVNTTSGDVSNTHVHDENCSHDTTQPELKKTGDGATLETAKATHIATIEIEDYGTIKAELYGNTAPISVNNFVALAEQGFYDGLTFHRIINGFMMQGGAGNSQSPAVQAIEGEFSANGIENNLLHLKGVLSMARTYYEMNSATSQFFIIHEDSPHLDGDYAAFGRVIEGQDIVDEICGKFPSEDSTIATEDQPVIQSITVEKVN